MFLLFFRSRGAASTDKVGQFPKDNVEVLILKPGSTGKDYADSPRAPSLKQRLMVHTHKHTHTHTHT